MKTTPKSPVGMDPRTIATVRGEDSHNYITTVSMFYFVSFKVQHTQSISPVSYSTGDLASFACSSRSSFWMSTLSSCIGTASVRQYTFKCLLARFRRLCAFRWTWKVHMIKVRESPQLKKLYVPHAHTPLLITKLAVATAEPLTLSQLPDFRFGGGDRSVSPFQKFLGGWRD